LTVLADAPSASSADLLEIPAEVDAMPAMLRDVGHRYGDATADFVALQLEYDR
jgi:hypothetical protein